MNPLVENFERRLSSGKHIILQKECIRILMLTCEIERGAKCEELESLIGAASERSGIIISDKMAWVKEMALTYILSRRKGDLERWVNLSAGEGIESLSKE